MRYYAVSELPRLTRAAIEQNYAEVVRENARCYGELCRVPCQSNYDALIETVDYGGELQFEMDKRDMASMLRRAMQRTPTRIQL